MRFLLAAGLCAAGLMLAAAPVLSQGAGGAAPAARLEVLDYTAPVPADWEPVPPMSRFRAAQFRVPGAPGAAPAEAIVYYFGKGQGGTAAANAARWASQFKSADGKAVEPKIETLAAGGMPATIVELSGSYARGIGTAQGVEATPGQTLMAAVIESPQGNLTIQLHGDQATVEQGRAGFMAMVRGFHGR